MRWQSLGSSPLDVGLRKSKGPSIPSVSGLCPQHLTCSVFVMVSIFLIR